MVLPERLMWYGIYVRQGKGEGGRFTACEDDAAKSTSCETTTTTNQQLILLDFNLFFGIDLIYIQYLIEVTWVFLQFFVPSR